VATSKHAHVTNHKFAKGGSGLRGTSGGPSQGGSLRRDGPTIVVSIIPEGKGKERLDESARILSLEFEDNDGRADKLTLEIENGDLRNFDDPIWAKGGAVIAQWGYEGALCQPRECVIQKITGFQKLKVEALAKSILLHKSKRARKWTGLKRSQVVEQIAIEWGYDATHRDIEDTVIVCETIHQAGMTDAQLLTRLAKKEGFQFYIDHSGLHFHRRKFEQAPRRLLTWFTDPGQGDVLEVNIENDVTARPGKVTVTARDPLKRTTVSESGSTTATKHATLASTVEVIDEKTATTTRKNIVATETRAGTASNAAAAKREADGKFLGAAALVVKLKALILGDPLLNAKTVVEWAGLGKRLSGLYYVRQVTHHVAGGNFKQDIQCVRNGGSEYGATRSGGKLNTQKAPTKSGAAGADKSALKTEVINAPDGTTSTRWTKP
jgi:phage protein D